MTAMPNQGYDGADPGSVKIAQITFAYNNSQIINWLTKRGTLIKSEKWDDLHKLEEKIIGELADQTPKYKTKAGKKSLLDLQ